MPHPLQVPGPMKALWTTPLGVFLSFIASTLLVLYFLHLRPGGAGPHGMGDLLYPLAWMVSCPLGFVLGLIAGLLKPVGGFRILMALAFVAPAFLGSAGFLAFKWMAS